MSAITLTELRDQLKVELNYHVRRRLQKQIADAERKDGAARRKKVPTPNQLPIQ